MALIDKLNAIADAIRNKTGGTDELTLDQMAAEIEGIQTGIPINNQDKAITENGTYTADEGYTGLGEVVVNVPGSTEMEDQFIAAIERGPTQVTKLPDGVTRIGYEAFKGCPNLVLTSLPDGLTYIDSYAFKDCTNLALTSLPDGVTRIGYEAFSGCTKLALTSLPDGLAYVDGYAFKDCSKLTELTFKGKPSSISYSAFKYCTNLLTINVPWAEGEVEDAPWGATNATINYNYVEEG